MNKETKKQQGVNQVQKNYHNLMRRIRKDLQSMDTDTKPFQCALCLYIMFQTGERLGNEMSEKLGHFGISTLRVQHVLVSVYVIDFAYVGKSGVAHQKRIVDPLLAPKISAMLRGKQKSDKIFSKIGRKDVNDYLRPFGFTSKSIRTYLINERVSADCESVKETAAFIGHKPQTLKNHYLLTTTKKRCKL